MRNNGMFLNQFFFKLKNDHTKQEADDLERKDYYDIIQI